MRNKKLIPFRGNYGKLALPDMMDMESRPMLEPSIRFREKKLQSYFLCSVLTVRAAVQRAGR